MDDADRSGHPVPHQPGDDLGRDRQHVGEVTPEKSTGADEAPALPEDYVAMATK